MEAVRRQAGQLWSSPNSHPDPAGEDCGWIYQERAKRKVPVIAVDAQELWMHVAGLVRQSVEETLGSLLGTEVGALR